MNIKMKLHNIEDIEKFFEVVDSCKEKVELVNKDMCINLKSKISQYFALAEVFSDGTIQDLEIRCHCEEDNAKMLQFMINGNK